MWKLFHHSSRLNHSLRCSLNRNCVILKACRRSHFTEFPKRIIANKNGSLVLSSLKKIGYTFACGTVGQIVICNATLCQPEKSRLSGYQVEKEESKFDWAIFWSYLKPHLWYCVAAIAGALAVAFLNIQIPQIIGDVVNLIARFSNQHEGKSFLTEMKSRAVKLISFFLAQSSCTFFYIYMLSILGEKIACKMKTDLFASVLRQDIAFFDQQRTGEIINRLTTDIQEFKSSFKQTISGGLRALTQIVGSSMSLIFISRDMTFITLLCIPSIIAVGSIVGSLLRLTSRKAQAQVEKATAVADEAVGNIRTVRAFAMEDQENKLFDREAEKAMILNQRLGLGIGLFQAGTNMFLNGMLLGTLYMGGYLLSVNQLTPGQLMAFLMASQTIQRSLAQMSLLFGSVIRGMSAGSRIFEYMKLQPSMSLQGGNSILIDHLKGDIVFKDVDFVYPARSEHASD